MTDTEEKTDSGSGLTDMVRELALTGLATFFMTEDSVRKYLKDLKLPKELGSLLLDSIGRKKDDIYSLLGKELTRMLARVDFAQELGKFLQNHRVHVEAKFSFEPKTKEGKG